jgi:hypothetical protein
MSSHLLIGTDQGLFLVDELPFEQNDAEKVLDCGKIMSVRGFDHTDDILVASENGGFKSSDGGKEWEDLGVPLGERYWFSGQSELWSILATPDGTIYAGTNDPYLFQSHDGGETWSEVRSFRGIPSRGYWESPVDPHYARLRGLENVPGSPEYLVVGIEAGGIHISKDGGQTWIDRRGGLPDDIHHIYPFDSNVFFAATGHLDHHVEHIIHGGGLGGIYRSVDAGENWTRLDIGSKYTYIRRLFLHDGTLYYSGATRGPPEWEDEKHEAALFKSTDLGRQFERVPYAGEPSEVIEAWEVFDDQVICGSGLFDIPGTRKDIDGRIMCQMKDGRFETVGELPGNISSGGLLAIN